MNWFKLAQKFLFKMDPETAHNFALKFLSSTKALWERRELLCPKKVMGVTFPNPVGVAAGMDKDGRYYDMLLRLGFGFVEVGTVTPQPQEGNPRPRIFRLPEVKGIVNKMGFPNDGAVALANRLRMKPKDAVVGVSIGRGKDKSTEDAILDYLFGLQEFHNHASYVAINISSPNTKGLRELEQPTVLGPFLERLAQERVRLANALGRRTPLALKISPDVPKKGLKLIANLAVKYGVDGIIATNTTSRRPRVGRLRPAVSLGGGLSGAPLKQLALQTVRRLDTFLQGEIPIIGCGGIMCAKDVLDMNEAGASMVQILSGFVYEGPQLVDDAVNVFRSSSCCDNFPLIMTW
jgi:dihydroorotate dehydrogenase